MSERQKAPHYVIKHKDIVAYVEENDCVLVPTLYSVSRIPSEERGLVTLQELVIQFKEDIPCEDVKIPKYLFEEMVRVGIFKLIWRKE